jgi:hypothetical protein
LRPRRCANRAPRFLRPDKFRKTRDPCGNRSALRPSDPQFQTLARRLGVARDHGRDTRHGSF